MWSRLKAQWAYRPPSGMIAAWRHFMALAARDIATGGEVRPARACDWQPGRKWWLGRGRKRA